MSDLTPGQEARERAERIAEKLDARQVGDRWRVECPSCGGKLELRGEGSENGWPLYQCYGSNFNCAKDQPAEFRKAMVAAGVDAADVFRGTGAKAETPDGEKPPPPLPTSDEIEEWHARLIADTPKAVEWLAKRGITEEDLTDYRIGYGEFTREDGRKYWRITLPVWDADRRKLLNLRRYNPKANKQNKWPKWTSWPGTHNSIFPASALVDPWLPRSDSQKNAIVAAGEWDAIVTRRKLAEAEITDWEVVTFLGGEGSVPPPAILAPLTGWRVVVAYDADNHQGRPGAASLASALWPLGSRVSTPDLFPGRDDGSDLTDWWKEGRTAEELLSLIEATPDFVPPDDDRFPLGEFMRKPPPVDMVADDWLYRGLVHILFSDTGIGKTWIALWLMAKEIAAGNYVAYFDEENGPEEIAERLVALGVSPEDVDRRLLYYPDAAGFDDAKLEWIVKRYAPTLAVYDTTIAFLVVSEIEENDSVQVSAWMRDAPKRLAKLGPAVAVLDHVKLDAKNPPAVPRASSAKLGNAQVGISFWTKNSERFERDSTLTVYVHKPKDRKGRLTLPDALEMTSSDGGSKVRIEELEDAADPFPSVGGGDLPYTRASVAAVFEKLKKEELSPSKLASELWPGGSRRDSYRRTQKVRAMAKGPDAILEERETGLEKPTHVYRLRSKPDEADGTR